MNPLGISLTDVWYDIPPVRHPKYKARKDANELSVKLLDRIIEMSTDVGDTILIHLEEQELHTLQLKLNKGNGLE